MNEDRLRHLMQEINSGALSRNKQFDAFKDPIVRKARRRQYRLDALETLLTQSSPEFMTLRRSNKDDRWELGCSFPQWKLNWSAFLLDFEVDWLRDRPQVRAVMHRHGVAP